jgi:hypothetical protein
MKPEPERVPILKRRMGYGTVGSFLLYVIAVVVGVATLIVLGRIGVFDPFRGAMNPDIATFSA